MATDFAVCLQRFLTSHLAGLRGYSPNTIASYRDTFCLLFSFAQARLCKPPSDLALDDLDAPFICAFLDDLDLTETELLIGARIVKEIRQRLTFLDDVGVGYLQLERASGTLSGGEAQRLRLASARGIGALDRRAGWTRHLRGPAGGGSVPLQPEEKRP